MAHLALYREFRPQRFADVVGQNHITRTLRNALVQNRLHHAYLLSGPRGTGKTSVARLLAKAVNCLRPEEAEPCNQCAACQSINSGETMDIIEIDAASNRGIDEIRDLRDKVKYAPADLKYKVYIIDEVHMLSEPAFNALLKTLEEPPGHVLFVLATTEKHKLPITIVSRCQSFDYHRLSASEIIGRLEAVCQKYQVRVEPDALEAIARQAEGGMRDALSLLDQVMAYAESKEIRLEDTLQVLGSAPAEQLLRLDQVLLEGNAGGGLLLLDEMIRQGKDLRQLVRDYLAHLRDLLLVRTDAGESVLGLPKQQVSDLRSVATVLQQEQILAAIRLLAQLEGDIRFTTSQRLLIEVAIIRVAGLFGTETVDRQSGETAKALPSDLRSRGNDATDAGRGRAPLPQNPSVAAGPTLARPEPPPVTPAPAGDVRTENAVAQAWDQILDLIRRARPSTMPLLAKARVGSVRGSRVILVAGNATYAELLKRKDDMDILQKAIARLGLGNMEIVPVGPDHPFAKEEVEAQPTPQSAAESSEPTLLDLARDAFGEVVTEVEEDDPK